MESRGRSPHAHLPVLTAGFSLPRSAGMGAKLAEPIAVGEAVSPIDAGKAYTDTVAELVPVYEPSCFNLQFAANKEVVRHPRLSRVLGSAIRPSYQCPVALSSHLSFSSLRSKSTSLSAFNRFGNDWSTHDTASL